MFEQKIKASEEESLVDFLSKLDLFANVQRKVIRDILKLMTLVTLEGGNKLFQQGEIDNTLYVLYKGRLRVYVEESANSIAEISEGEVVGVVSFFFDKPRPSTVRAVRTSQVLKLTKEVFTYFEYKEPKSFLEMAKIALKHSIEKKRASLSGEHFKTLTIMPAGDSDHYHFAMRLYEELSKIKPTVLINQEFCNAHFGRKIAQTNMGEADNALIDSWLQSLETEYTYVLFVTDRQMTPWTQRCLRQADRIQIVAESNTYPVLNGIELALFNTFFSVPPCMELVFIHPDNQNKNSGSSAWLNARKLVNFYHLRLGVQNDVDRYVRLLTGRSLGVVLNGGGARGFAHIGVIKALEELGKNIDIIGGCSMGAIVAASYAIHMDAKEVMKYIDHIIRGYQKDYTVPLISILKGINCQRALNSAFGGIAIEDLYLRYYCVSSNLTKSRLEVHTTGSLAKAVRASLTIPGVYPPVYNENGDLLVDGGIIDNMPVETMRNMQLGGKILAVNCHMLSKSPEKPLKRQGDISAWDILWNKINPFRSEFIAYDSLDKILISALGLAADEHQEVSSKKADYLLELDTHKYPMLDSAKAAQIVDLGYQTALEQLPQILGSQS